MVAGHESRGRLAALDAENAELCTRAAVLEPGGEGGAATRAAAAVEARARCDAAAQHGEAVWSFMASQEAGAARLRKAAAEWEP